MSPHTTAAALRMATAVDTGPIALTYEAAAIACGCSIDVIRRAVRAGDLTPRYPSSRPVLLRTELEEWLDSRHAPARSGARRVGA